MDALTPIAATTLTCSFCCARQSEVERIVVGPACVAICSDCIENCSEIVREGRTETSRRGWPSSEAFLFWGVLS